jgi:serine beta-lactamase-like protein LACTB
MHSAAPGGVANTTAGRRFARQFRGTFWSTLLPVRQPVTLRGAPTFRSLAKRRAALPGCTPAQDAAVRPHICHLAVLLFLAVATPAQQPDLSAQKRALISQAVSDFQAATNVPGLSIAVVLDGQPAWSVGFGMADLENSVPATPATLFRLASVSKPLTATAILQLWERGKLDLDAPVQKYCPAFPQKNAPITSRMLLNHLSGIRHYNPDNRGDIPDDSARHFTSMKEALAIFEDDPLLSPPGAEFHYSTYGYTVLGCVLEGASGEKYIDFVRENVFLPANMAHSQADDFFAIIPHRTRWYHKDAQGVVQNAGVLDSSYKIPGGGWLSSADDLALYEYAILTDRLIKRTTRDLMWTPGKTTAGKQLDYGLGWDIAQWSGITIYGHTGGQQGTSTYMGVVPARNAGVVVLANLDGADVTKLAHQILSILLDLPEPSL